MRRLTSRQTLTHSSSRSHVMTKTGRVENPGPHAAHHTHPQSEGEANPLPDSTGNYANVVCESEMVMLLRVHTYRMANTSAAMVLIAFMLAHQTRALASDANQDTEGQC